MSGQLCPCWISCWYPLSRHVWWFLGSKTSLACVRNWTVSQSSLYSIHYNVISSNIFGTNLLSLQEWKTCHLLVFTKLHRGWICAGLWHCFSKTSMQGRSALFFKAIYIRKTKMLEGKKSSFFFLKKGNLYFRLGKQKCWNRCVSRCTRERWIYVSSSDIVNNLKQDIINFSALCWPFMNLQILDITHNKLSWQKNQTWEKHSWHCISQSSCTNWENCQYVVTNSASASHIIHR